MKGLIEFIIELAIGVIIATVIINCQNAQRRCNIEPEVLGAGQHKQVYYEYQDYMNNRSFKNN